MIPECGQSIARRYNDMSSNEKYMNFNLELQRRVEEEIIKVQKGNSTKNINQLNSILNELKGSLNKRGLKLAFPRMIIDSWDYKDKLGLDLIQLSEMYMQIE